MAGAFDTLKDAASDLVGGFGVEITQKEGLTDPIYSEKSVAEDKELDWAISATDWHKVFAYQFAVIKAIDKQEEEKDKKKDGGGLFAALGSFFSGLVSDPDPKPTTNLSEFLYTLPIPPQTFSVKMVTASEATPTMGGVVEQTNANVFWLISMSGTTGIAVTRGETGLGAGRDKVATRFRDTIKTTGLMAGPLAGINGALSKIGGVADKVASFAASGDPKDLVGAFNTALLPPLPYAGSAVDKTTNGFTEAQELHRFFYTYSKLKDKDPNLYSLRFRNYKTGQDWRCVIQDFQLQKNAQNPMLERYVITLKCWDLKPIGAEARAAAEFDRFGSGGDLQEAQIIDVGVMAKLAGGMFGGELSPDNLLKK